MDWLVEIVRLVLQSLLESLMVLGFSSILVFLSLKGTSHVRFARSWHFLSLFVFEHIE